MGVMSQISLFCTLADLENIMLCCKGWSQCISYYDETKWRIWYNAIHHEMKSIESLDRTGTSNHFIVTQNCYDSFDSVYHFAKFSRFSSHLIDSNAVSNCCDVLLFDELIKINQHSQSVIHLFVDALHKKILFEFKEKLDDEESSKTSNGSGANPELLYINSYDTASDTDTEHKQDGDEEDESSEDVIVIDDNEYHSQHVDIILIRNNIKNIVQTYKYFLCCIQQNNYLKLLHLFENIILIESRPILRWFLFITDRSQCFGKNELKFCTKNNDKKVNIGDITVWSKYLENYILEIHSILALYKTNLSLHENNEKIIKYVNNHQQYLLKMCVDFDEVRA